MTRFNGWGDARIQKHLPPSAQKMLGELVGIADPGVSVPLRDQVQQVPTSKLPAHPMVDTDAETRLRHAHGQSLPDWVALRHGRLNQFPDGVARPQSLEELRDILSYAEKAGAAVIPYGGGTSVVGHLTPRSEKVLTVSLARFNRMVHMDASSRLATFGAGITGPDLEAALRAHGFTLGHYPQSFEYSTLGGWVVTRSSGQQSLGYGRIEDMFAGGTLVSPTGDLHMPTHAASSAGPDLRQMVLGSEGRMGILGEVTIRVREVPHTEEFHACFFPNWQAAFGAVHELSSSDIPLSMMRLSNEIETQTNLTLAGKERAVGYLKTYLKLRGVGEDACMLLIGFSTHKRLLRRHRDTALSLCKSRGGVHLHQPLGKAWRKNRFKAPYLRNTLWDLGYAVDTLETCVSWKNVTEAMNAIETALRTGLEHENEQVHVFTHLSHFYPTGCSIYTTYLWRLSADPEQTLERWRKLKGAASQQIVAYGGTISHQHGVGEDHAPYLTAEKGERGMAALQHMLHHFDPEGMMNPGKLLKGGYDG